MDFPACLRVAAWVIGMAEWIPNVRAILIGWRLMRVIGGRKLVLRVATVMLHIQLPQH